MRPRFCPHIPPDGVVVDVGTHAGQNTKLFAAMLPHGHALSLLRRVKSVRRLSNITIHPYGLDDLIKDTCAQRTDKGIGQRRFRIEFYR